MINWMLEVDDVAWTVDDMEPDGGREPFAIFGSEGME